MTRQTFGELLTALRQEQGLSRYALAQRAGLSDQAIHDLERIGRQPSFDTVRRLAGVLGVKLDWIADRLAPPELPAPRPGRPRGRPPKAKPDAEPSPAKKRGGGRKKTK